MTTPPVTDQQLLQKPKQKVKPFNDIARGFDPMMPKEEYDRQRDHYFNQYVAPHYKNEGDRSAGRDKFNTLTERKPLLTTGEKAALPLSIMATEFFDSAEKSKVVGGVARYALNDKGKAMLDQQIKDDDSSLTRMKKVAAREGITTRTGIGEAVGNLGEMGVELESIGGAAGMIPKLTQGLEVLKAGTRTAKYLGYANRLVRGGPTFAVYEGLHDEKGLAHSFIDGTFLRGLAEGRLWSWAGSGSLIRRVLKGGAVGAGIGATHTGDDNRVESALVGGLSGAAFGVLPGERENVKDKALQRALNPEEGKPLEKGVDEALSKSVMQSTAKAQREMLPPEIHVDEDLRGVKIRAVDPKGEPMDIMISPYAEGRALDALQKVTMAGGHVEGIDYSTTHGDTLNRFLHMQKLVGNGDKATEAKIAEESKQPTTEPSKGDIQYRDLQTADAVMLSHSSLPKTSKLYPELAAARKTARDTISQMQELFTWTANKVGESNEERKFLKYHLAELVNNRNLPAVHPTINGEVKLLAYKPELRELIPPQFRATFDTAVMQVPKGTRFETSFFNYKDAYKVLAPISPRRTPDELMEMSKMFTAIKDGEPRGGASEPGATTQARREVYNKAYQSSLSYPEIGQALPPNQGVAWERARQAKIEADATAARTREAQVLQKPLPSQATRYVDPEVKRLRSIWAENRWNREEEALRVRQAAEANTLPDLSEVEVSEIDKVMQEEIAGKSRGIQNPGVAEEFLRTGQWTKEDGRRTIQSELKVPPSEAAHTLTMGDNAKIEDGVLKVYVPAHVIDREYEMAGAFYQPGQVLQVLDDLGFRDHPPEVMNYLLKGDRLLDPMNGNLLAGPGTGMVVLPVENPVQHEFHELMHHAVDHISGLSGYHPEHFGITDIGIKTLRQISEEINKHPAYNDPSIRVYDDEEAFVHAATAVVKGDKHVLAGMGLVDTDVDHVVAMVQEVSTKALRKLQQRPDWQELRDVKNRFDVVQKSSSPMVSYSLRNAADKLQSDMYTDELGQVYFTGGDGVNVFKDKSEAFQHLFTNDFTGDAPSWTAPMEQMGVLTDSPTLARFSPSRSPIMREPSADADNAEKRMSVTDFARPLGPWVGDAQKVLDRSWQGLQAVPLLEKVKAVDDAFRDNMTAVEVQRKEFHKNLKEFSSEKLYDVFNFLSVDPKNWPRMQGKYNMSDTEMTHVRETYDKLRALDANQHLGIFNYFLRELPILRANAFRQESVYAPLEDPSKASTFHRGMMEGRFKPQDTHAGRFINYVLGASRDKTMEKPLYELRQTINLKDRNGDYVLGALRGSFNRWADYMTYRPDASQRMVNNFTQSIQNSILAQFKRLNKHLPKGAQLPEEFEYPAATMNKLMTISYAADVGFRASAAIRDAIQPYLTSLPIIGPNALARGMAKGLSQGGWDAAEKAGALLHATNPTELYGDVFQELPVGGHSMLDKGVTAAGKILTPSRIGHNIGRLFVYHGALDAAERSITNLRAGKISADKFLVDTGTWYLTKPERSRYLTQAMDQTNERRELAKRISLDIVDRTLWAYRRGQQPGVLRTGAGRIFGQYGNWPLNFGEYLRNIGARALEGGTVGRQALKAGAIWLGANLATYEVFDKGMGVDAGKWLFVSPSGFAGGPALQTTLAAGQSLEDTSEGEKARHTLVEAPLHFIPGSNWARSVLGTVNDDTYWDSDNTPTQAGWMKLMGFTPVNEKEREREADWTIEQRLRKGTGFTPGKGSITGGDK